MEFAEPMHRVRSRVFPRDIEHCPRGQQQGGVERGEAHIGERQIDALFLGGGAFLSARRLAQQPHRLRAFCIDPD